MPLKSMVARPPWNARPDGLLMIPVPAGQHRVNLSYIGTTNLRVSFWFTPWCMACFLRFLGLAPASDEAGGHGYFPIWTGRYGDGRSRYLSDELSAVQPAFLSPSSLDRESSGSNDLHLTGRPERRWETLWTFDHLGTTWKVNCYYENGQNMRLALARGSTLHAVSEAFQINVSTPAGV